ncbi:uncharacterized protein DFL_006795 [Arthrobotrys flagrans]|uniref:3CxxC-type domain-containing protein n=1 Tax=Arthrobotrys flagrans TaxID=97331 RepID=A0A436ZTV4_ARTFL|nr:hypothetical protein DFL_006795 [Arthrobotrys flagrans]
MSNSNETIREKLAAMDISQLNNLDIQDYPPGQGRLINKERARREKAEANVTYTDPTATADARTLESDETVNDSIIPRHQPNDPGAAGSRRFRAKKSPKSDNLSGISPRRENTEPEPWYLFENYHEKVSEKMKDVIFISKIEDGNLKAETNLVGTFKCIALECRAMGWSNGTVATVIRAYYQDDGKLGYSAQVYNQRCRSCKQLASMKLDVDTYVERVVRRLKMWKGEYAPIKWYRRKMLPHDEELCEACKAGHCLTGVVNKQHRLSGVETGQQVPVKI